jgi:hypothetical protein
MPRAAGTALEQRLGQLGWIEGRTFAIERRWADARNSRFADVRSNETYHVPRDLLAMSAGLGRPQRTILYPLVAFRSGLYALLVGDD